MTPRPVSDWRSEIIQLPPEFAPTLPAGQEELRFAPGMFEPAAADYFTYAFVLRLAAPMPPDGAQIEALLDTYFQGLVAAVAKSRGLTLPVERIDATVTGQAPTGRRAGGLRHGPESARPGCHPREQVCARFVVDATGRGSLYARRMGAHQRELDMLVSVATAVATGHALYEERRFDHPRVWLEALSQTRHLAGVLTECEVVADSSSACTALSPGRIGSRPAVTRTPDEQWVIRAGNPGWNSSTPRGERRCARRLPRNVRKSIGAFQAAFR